MRRRTWCLAALCAWLLVAVASPADAHDLEPTARPKIVFRGRAVTNAAWGALGGGGLTMGVAGLLTIYDFDGDPFDKWKYDRGFLRRMAVSDPMLFTGAGIMGSHVPLLATGVVVEGVGLRRLTPLTVVPGWLGLGLIMGGATALPIGGGGFGLVIGGTFMGVGYLCSLAQYGLNVRASNRWLTPEIHDELYHPRRSVVVVGAPLLLERGGGASVLLVF